MGLRLEHISKTFGAQEVLKDVSLSMEDGEIVGLLGPNGAGKSTLMKIMVGLWKPDQSRVDSRESRVDVPERVGYLPEQNPLYEEMYVFEYLQFFANMSNIGDWRLKNEELRLRVEELIRRVGLTPEAHKKIGQLSKGYRQRVGLAQALLSDPDLLVLDEPTTGLDPNQLVEIRSLIKQLGRDRMVILSTHILQEVKEICDRVIVLDHGQIKADKPIGEIQNLEAMFRSLTIDDR